MRYTIATLMVSILFLAGAISYCDAAEYYNGSYAPPYTYGAPEGTALHSLASHSLARISYASRRGIDTSEAMRFQTEGDAAMHRGDLVRAAEDYGVGKFAVLFAVVMVVVVSLDDLPEPLAFD